MKCAGRHLFIQLFHLPLLAFWLRLSHGQPVEVALRKCLPGIPCRAHISSASYTDHVPHLLVAREDHSCGSPPDAQFLAENPIRGSMPIGNISSFDFGVMGPSPGLYRLCLCTVNCVVSSQVSPLSFSEDVGDLLVSGPLEAKQAPANCFAGGPCIVNISALGVHPGDVLTVMESGSNCSSSPFAIVSPQRAPVEVATPYGIGRGSIEFLLDEEAISPNNLSAALVVAFANYFGIGISSTNGGRGVSGVFLADLLLRGQSMLPNVSVQSRRLTEFGDPDAWEVAYELLDGFDKVRAVKSLVATWRLPMGSSNTSFQYFLQDSVASLASNTSLADELSISNFTDISIQKLTAKEAETFLTKQGSASFTGRSLRMLPSNSWRRLSAEEVSENFSSDESEAAAQVNLTDDSDMLNQSTTSNDTSDSFNDTSDSFLQITLTLRSSSISYHDLMNSPEVSANLVRTLQIRFASLAGTTPENVHVGLASGSLLIYVTILVPDHAAVDTRSQIAANIVDGTIASTVAIDLSLVPGISQVSFGPITINVDMMDGQKLNADDNATLSTLAKRAHLLAGHVAFELDLVGGNWLLCYRFGDGDSSMEAGNLPILGAGLLRSVGRARIGRPFAVEVYAPLGGLLLEDRLMIIEVLEGRAPACGATPTTMYLQGSLDSPDVGSTGNANTSLQWQNLVINHAGIYTGCWCWSGQGECSANMSDEGNSSKSFSLELNNFTVHGPRRFQPTRVAAGDRFEFTVLGVGLGSLDVIRFANGSACGTAAVDSVELIGGQGAGSTRTWPNQTVMEYGSYQVCWCMSDENCSNAEEADFSVGVLEVWGPIMSRHRCIMSSMCVVALDGVSSQEPSSILLRSGEVVCGGSQALPVDVQGLTNPQRSQAATAGLYSRIRFSPVRARSGRTVQFAELVLYFNGSQVDTHGASTRRLPEGRGPLSEGPEFAIDRRRSTKFLDFDGIGFEIALVVPARIDAVSYITANDSPERDLTSFLLEGFSDKWHVLAAPEQVSPPLERFTETSRIPCVTELLHETVLRTVYSLGVPIGKSPGLSSICWQHGDDAGFAVQAGSLEFAGLMGTQSSRCFFGRRCTFGPVLGYSLSSADRVVAVPSSEHCSQGLGPISTAAVSSRPSWAGPWTVSVSEVNGSQAVSVDWMPGAIYSGKWKLCYCVQTDLGCTSAASFTIEMGLLSVVGPVSVAEQNFSCSMNASTCSIGPLTGEGISPADLILLVPAGEACGNLSAALPESIGMSDLTGLVLASTSGAGALQDTLTFAVDNASARTQSPGSWMMCYCAAGGGGNRCDDESEFSAPLGHLVVVGPEQMTYHCTLGLPCRVQLAGHGLHLSNAIMVIDGSSSCGFALPFLKHEGISWPQRAQGMAGQFYAGLPTGGPVGPVGRLCWAVGWSRWEDFTVDVGSFEMSGPQQDQNFTCTLGISCWLPILGHRFGPSSEVWIIGGERVVSATWEANALDRSCTAAAQSDAAQIDGVLNPSTPQLILDTQATYNPGIARAGQVGPFFRVCWRYSQGSPFVVEVGRFALQGPQATSGSCVKGYPCNVTLGGFGLNSRNILRVLDANCTFSNGSSPPENASEDTSDAILSDAAPRNFYPDATGLLGTTEHLNPRAGTDNIYDLGTITRGVPGTHLFLCWSGGVTGELTPIGSVQLAGPHDDQDLACDSGRPCEPNILGFASPWWREYWLVTGTGQYLPNFSIFLSSKCEPVWGRHGGDLAHTWERIPGAEKGVVYFVSGKLQACPNYALHLHPLDCSVVATAWSGLDASKSWIELSSGAGNTEMSEYWILTSSTAPCPSKMLTAEAGTLRGIDFFRSPLTRWKIPGRDASPWPHRSSFLLLPQGSGCNTSAAIEKEGLSNPSQCCNRRGQELQLRLSLGSFGTGSGRYDVCWGRTFGDGANGGADNPLPSLEFPIFVGVLSLLAPESLGAVQCTLGLPCLVTLSGLGLSALDSLVIHSGTSCTWPELPPFDSESAPECSTSGSDSYMKAEIVGNQRLVLATTCPRGGYEEFGGATPKALLRTYSFPSVAQVMEYSSLLLPNGIAGVALDGLAISGAPANESLWNHSQCGLVIERAMAEYALTPGGRWGGDRDGCEVVKSWALDSAVFNASHEAMLGFMMDGVPLFAPLSNSSFTLDPCGGHDDDLPFYHYHAAESFDTYSGKILGCLRAAASGGNGFAVPPARISWPPVRPQHFLELDGLMATLQYGNQEVLLTNARAASRFLPQSLDNASQAVYYIQRPAKVLNYSICWGRGLGLNEHQVFLGSLIYIGPFEKDYWCSLGRECTLQIEGAGLSLDNKLFLSNDTCDAPMFEIGVSLTGLREMPTRPVLASANSSLYNLGLVMSAVVGPTFLKICWSDSPGNVVKVGALEFAGPARVDQHFTCSPGRTCNLRLHEYALSTSPLPQLRVGTSCGEATLEGVRVRPGSLAGAIEQDASWAWEYSFGLIPPDAEPGHYALCWHPTQVLQDTLPVSSGIRIGQFTLRGPRVLEVLPPAVAGQFFQLKLQGVALSDMDDIRILDNSTECGGDGGANNSQYVNFGMEPSQVVLNTADLVDPRPNSTDTSGTPRRDQEQSSAGTENDTDTSDTELPDNSDGGIRSPQVLTVGVWENVSIQVGGVFKVCWCSGGPPSSNLPSTCREDADFAVNAGSLLVRGAAPLAETEGTQIAAGTPFLLKFNGIMLSEFDHMHIIPAGSRCYKANERPYQHESGIQLRQPLVSPDGAEAEWGNVTIMTAGLYEACFCPGSLDQPCTEDYTHIGHLAVV